MVLWQTVKTQMKCHKMAFHQGLIKKKYLWYEIYLYFENNSNMLSTDVYNGQSQFNLETTSMHLVKSAYQKLIVYFSTKTYVMVTQKNRLNETVLLSTHSICLNWLVRTY